MLCNKDGTNAVPTHTLAPIPAAPTESFYCGTSYGDASKRYAHIHVQVDHLTNAPMTFSALPAHPSEEVHFSVGQRWKKQLLLVLNLARVD